MDRMNCLDGLHINWEVIQVYRRRHKLEDLRKRSLGRFLLLRTLSRSTTLDIDLDFLFPVLMEDFWTTKGVVASSSPLMMGFSLFSLIVAILAMNKLKI